MIETVASVALLGLLMITLGSVSMVKLSAQDSVEKQYSVLSADAYLADIYRDFHEAVSYSFVESPAGQKILTFVLEDGSSNIYSLDPSDSACYKNGVWQFKATSFDVVGTPVNLTVSVKLPNERILDFTAYR